MRNHQPSVCLVKIPVIEFERSVRFYRESLGLEEEGFYPEYRWANFRAGGVLVSLYGAATAGGAMGFHFAVSGLKGLEGTLRERQVQIVDGYARNDDGTHSIKIADPDGNVLTLMEFPVE